MASTRRPTATNDNIRDLLDDLRLEIKGDIKDLSKKVDDLDKAVQNNALKQAVSSTKIGALIAGITIVVSAAVSFIVNKVLTRSLS